MKTIFVSALEGIEVKNILRTNVINTVLKDGGVRVVLLVKNEERAAYYRKEFNGPHITYAVVPYDRSLGKGIDRPCEETRGRHRRFEDRGGRFWRRVQRKGMRSQESAGARHRALCRVPIPASRKRDRHLRGIGLRRAP